MKKIYLMTAGIIIALLATGCQAANSNNENEALKQQITQLEQQISTLEAEGTTASIDTEENDVSNNTNTQTDSIDTKNEGNNYTLEELTSMVDAFVEKANAAAPTGTEQEIMEQVFSLKQEENQIDNALDFYEDELEIKYDNGELTREEYKKLERELERLDDRLDDAEDWLEYTFGIDD